MIVEHGVNYSSLVPELLREQAPRMNPEITYQSPEIDCGQLIHFHFYFWGIACMKIGVCSPTYDPAML